MEGPQSDRPLDLAGPFPLAQNFSRDVLGEIFVRCLPENGLSSLPLRRRESPLSVSHVCQQWRAAALQHRRLWAGVDVVCSHAESWRNKIASALRAYLERSGNVNLHIKFQTTALLVYGLAGRREYVTVSWEHVEPLILRILEHARHIKHLELVMTNTYAERILNTVKDSELAVTALKLQIHEDRMRAVNVIGRDLIRLWIKACGQLSELHLDGSLPITIDLADMPQFPKLRKLSLAVGVTQTFGPSLASLLCCFPLIEQLHLSATQTALHCWKDNTRIDGGSAVRRCFPSIRRLDVVQGQSQIRGSCNCVRLLPDFQMPSLTVLVIDTQTAVRQLATRARDWSALINFIRGANARLETLMLRAVPLTEQETRDCLGLLPDLKYLHVPLSEFLVDVLSPPSNSDRSSAGITLCPLLDSIAFEPPFLLNEDAARVKSLVDVATKVIRSRWAPLDWGDQAPTSPLLSARTLRRVILPRGNSDQSREFSRSISMSMADCVSLGLEIKFDDPFS